MATDTAKVGKGTKKFGPISSVFVDACVPKPGTDGVGVATSGGADIAGAPKESDGVTKGVTYLSVEGAAPGSKASGKSVSNRSKF